jgi:hypothetical protein
MSSVAALRDFAGYVLFIIIVLSLGSLKANTVAFQVQVGLVVIPLKMKAHKFSFDPSTSCVRINAECLRRASAAYAHRARKNTSGSIAQTSQPYRNGQQCRGRQSPCARCTPRENPCQSVFIRICEPATPLPLHRCRWRRSPAGLRWRRLFPPGPRRWPRRPRRCRRVLPRTRRLSAARGPARTLPAS